MGGARPRVRILGPILLKLITLKGSAEIKLLYALALVIFNSVIGSFGDELLIEKQEILHSRGMI